MFELGKQFYFDAAHTLDRAISAESSRRVHGHSYRAAVTIRGTAQAATGMVLDLELLAREVETVRLRLDHRLLNEVEGLGAPTVENLCRFIWDGLADALPGLASVTIHRDSTGDWCTYHGPAMS